LIVVSGPSGAGKSSVVEGLAEQLPFHFSVSMTTRAARPGELEGVDYRFVDRTRFQEAVAAEELVEWAEYGGNLYGTPWDEVTAPRLRGQDVLLDIELVGARNVKKAYPEAIMIFIAPPDLAELERRLRARGDTSDADIARRLEVARLQMAEAPGLFEHLVVNDDLGAAVRQVAGILGVVPDPGGPS
jgi:guanylate kinase